MQELEGKVPIGVVLDRKYSFMDYIDFRFSYNIKINRPMLNQMILRTTKGKEPKNKRRGTQQNPILV